MRGQVIKPITSYSDHDHNDPPLLSTSQSLKFPTIPLPPVYIYMYINLRPSNIATLPLPKSETTPSSGQTVYETHLMNQET